MQVQVPKRVRQMDDNEYRIVSAVFADTLPLRWRILVTDAAGMDGRPFTIPTSLIPTILGMAAGSFLPAAAIGYLGSAVNAGYLINVGAAYDALGVTHQRLLVHETTHVWQGKNSVFALSYVADSVLNQGLHGSGAYAFVAGQPWKSYNVEQQATIVDTWFSSGMPAGKLYPYIRDHVRKGDA